LCPQISPTNFGSSPYNKEAFAFVWALNKAESLGILGSPSSWNLIGDAIRTMILAEGSFDPDKWGLTYSQRKEIYNDTPELIKGAFGMQWVKGIGYQFGNSINVFTSASTVEANLDRFIHFLGP
jgi:hypothetical protein